MKSFVYVPSICKGDGAEWEGSVKLRPLNFDEKFEYMELLGLTLLDNGDVDVGPATNRIQQQKKAVDLSEKHYLEINLKRKDGTEEVKSFSEMKEEPAMFPVLIEVSLIIMSGKRVGNG